MLMLKEKIFETYVEIAEFVRILSVTHLRPFLNRTILKQPTNLNQICNLLKHLNLPKKVQYTFADLPGKFVKVHNNCQKCLDYLILPKCDITFKEYKLLTITKDYADKNGLRYSTEILFKTVLEWDKKNFKKQSVTVFFFGNIIIVFIFSPQYHSKLFKLCITT
jgi:hypothetical protein